jgi:uncharacterized membrane protein
MEHRYARLFPLRVAGDAARLSVKVPRALYLTRGAVALVGAPVLGALFALLFVMMELPAEVGLLLAGGIAASLAAFALALFALSGVLSARSEVTFDRQASQIRRAYDGAVAPIASVVGVRVRPAGGLSGFQLLELVDASGRGFVLHARLSRQWPGDLAAVAHACATWLAVPADVPSADAAPLGITENHAALLCYLPIQGVFLIASIYFLGVDRRPFVRFSAKQSLLHFAASIVALVVALVLGATPVLLTEHAEGPARIASIVWLTLLLVALVAWNLGAHVYACVQAAKGRTWRMPWLRFLLARTPDR